MLTLTTGAVHGQVVWYINNTRVKDVKKRYKRILLNNVAHGGPHWSVHCSGNIHSEVVELARAAAPRLLTSPNRPMALGGLTPALGWLDARVYGIKPFHWQYQPAGGKSVSPE